MKIMIWIVLLMGLIACQHAEEPLKPVQAPATVNSLADQYIDNMFKNSPEWGTFYQIANADNVNLSDLSAVGIQQTELAQDALYQALKTVDVSKLNKNDNITYQLLKTELEGITTQRVCKKHLWSITQMDAFYLGFQYIGQTQPVGDEASRADALARWAKIPAYINNDMLNNKKGLETGYALPRPVVLRVIEQMEQLIASPLKDNVFYIPASRDENPEFQKKMQAQIENNIMPAVQTYLTFMRDEYLAKARPNLSISTIPNGEACYTAMLSAYTTLANGPAEIFTWGEEAVAEREAMIRTLGKQLYGSDDLTVIKQTFSNDPNNFFKTKTELLTDAQKSIERAKIKSKDYFNLYPKADVILEPISALEEKSGNSAYWPASDDGSRPATYIQATYQPEKQVRGEVESTAFHETYPGHHLQIAISRELVKSHPVTKYLGNSGFSEGWARYTETLADEIGLYSSDNHRIAMYMGLPTGMVVDPGIHLKNWTREQAIAYTLSKLTTMTQEDAEQYVDRISVWPGQMTTYGVGERLFINLRRQAEAKLAEDFDIKAFHDVCLQNGTVPLDFVAMEVAKYLENPPK